MQPKIIFQKWPGTVTKLKIVLPFTLFLAWINNYTSRIHFDYDTSRKCSDGC